MLETVLDGHTPTCSPNAEQSSLSTLVSRTHRSLSSIVETNNSLTVTMEQDLGGNTHGRGEDKNAADKVVAEIRAKGGKASANYDSVVDGDKIVQQALKEFGRVDIIVNVGLICGCEMPWLLSEADIVFAGPQNAGIARGKPFENYRDEDWDLVYKVSFSLIIVFYIPSFFFIDRACHPK